MHWEQFQQQWQQQTVPVAPSPAATVRTVLTQSRRLHRRVRVRDWIETVVALLMLPIFLGAAIHAGVNGDWATLFFSGWLCGWLLFAPWWFWRVRRRLPVPQPEQPLRRFLEQEREAMRAQAHLLESVWRWYLGPPAIGVIGFNFSLSGLTWGAFAYAVIVLVGYAAIDRINRSTARRRFRPRVADIDSLLSELAKETAS